MTGTLSVAIVVIAIVFAVLAGVAVALRFYCRMYKKTALGIDDWLLLPALLCTVAAAATNVVCALAGGLGEHGTVGPGGTISYNTYLINGETEWAMQVIAIPGFTLTKISILFFYRRIFRGWVFNAITWGLIALSATWGLSFFIATMAQCSPIQANWDPNYDTEQYCYDSYPMYLALAGSDFLIDTMILCVPWPNIWQLRLPTRQKFVLAGIFMLGALVCGIGVARFVFFVQFVYLPASDYLEPLYYGAPPVYWTQLQESIAVVCACLPTLRPLFQGFSPESIFGSRGGRISSRTSREPSRAKEQHGVADNSSVALHQLDTRSNDNLRADSISKTGIVVRHDYDLVFIPRES